MPMFLSQGSPPPIDRALLLLREESDVTPTTVQVIGVATHPEDNQVLATAVSAEADYLVTGDKQLLSLGRYQGVEICSPRAFHGLLQ